MSITHSLGGVYAAAVTPIDEKFNPDLLALQKLVHFFAENGCHGALILGTTGEGPSFNPAERLEIMQAAVQIKQSRPEFKLFAGTGTPSMRETIGLNQAAFELGFDAVVVLPPYYFRGAQQPGLVEWFTQVIDHSVPEDKILLGYHIPQVSGVPLTIDLLNSLGTNFPKRFGGLKDSQGSLENTSTLAAAFPDKLILVGDDRLLSSGLNAGASGCITALANLISPWLRYVFDNFGDPSTKAVQAKIKQARDIMDNFAPFPPSIKALLQELHGFDAWPVLPPLTPLPSETREDLIRQLKPLIIDTLRNQ